MNRKICCFAGHSKIYEKDDLYEKVMEIAQNLILNNGVTEFWVGNYGAFDKLSARAIRKLKEKYPDIELNLVVPYITAEINVNREEYYKNYDNILIADISSNTPKKLQIIKCNEYMVKNSEYMICFVEYHFGGAAKTLDFAQKQNHIQIFNIACM